MEVPDISVHATVSRDIPRSNEESMQEVNNQPLLHELQNFFVLELFTYEYSKSKEINTRSF